MTCKYVVTIEFQNGQIVEVPSLPISFGKDDPGNYFLQGTKVIYEHGLIGEVLRNGVWESAMNTVCDDESQGRKIVIEYKKTL